jgi:hypothetical protein
MKAKQFSAMTMFACVMLFATHTAQAFYNPSTGRWLNRDPMQEDGGENHYVFSGNTSVNWFDILGLTWKVDRQIRLDRARVKPEQGDTVAGLAKQVKLDTSDYKKWLKPVGPSRVPDSVTEPINDCSEYTLPNRVYLNRNVSSMHLAWWTWHRVEAASLAKQGFHLIELRDVTKWPFKEQFEDPHVYGIIMIAHADKRYKGDFIDDDGFRLLPTDVFPHHKLGGFKAIWCYSGGKEEEWREKVSEHGLLFTDPGLIFFWQTYPGGIEHGF